MSVPLAIMSRRCKTTGICGKEVTALLKVELAVLDFKLTETLDTLFL